MGDFFTYISYLFAWMPPVLRTIVTGFIGVLVVLFILKVLKLVWDALPVA